MILKDKRICEVSTVRRREWKFNEFLFSQFFIKEEFFLRKNKKDFNRWSMFIMICEKRLEIEGEVAGRIDY